MAASTETGARLDGRYRLDECRRSAHGIALWRATDEVLDRAVAAVVAPGLDAAARHALTASVARAGRVTDARWVRVLDVGAEAGDPGTAWVITEWVDAPSLATTLDTGPMKASMATAVVLACAQAVTAANGVGAHHGYLHPAEILQPPDASPRLTGLELNVALRHTAGAADAQPPLTYDDGRGLGALLFACLTGRWPLAGWDGLPNPTRGDGIHPRQQRRVGVSKELDQITATALTGGYPDPAAMVRDLAALPVAPLRAPPPQATEPKDHRWMRAAWRVVPPLLVAAIGWTAWTLGSNLGNIPSPARDITPAVAQPHQHGGNDTQQVVWSKPPTVSSFDPQGDGVEDPGGVGFAVDGDATTQWTTDTYRNNPRLGGLKPGVGLLLDLGTAKRVETANLLLSAPGADFQIRAGNVAPKQAGDLPVVASQDAAPTSAKLKLSQPVTARFWLLWITSLPKYGDGYRLGVAEIALLH